MPDYRQYFSVDDVISINNADRPAWCHCEWRVAEVSPTQAIVRPLLTDRTIDEQNDTGYRYVIADGGIVRYSLLDAQPN